MKKPDSHLDRFLSLIFERKAESVIALDVHELTSYTDTLVLVKGISNRQVTAMAEHLIQSLKKDKIQALGLEGVKDGEWALLDYGETILHIFEPDAYSFFNLEGLWADAPKIDLSEYDQTHGEKHND